MPAEPAAPSPPVLPRSPSSAVLAAILIAILGGGFAVRLYLAAVMPIVSRDSVTFIQYAQELGRDPTAEMRRQDQHPLYPAALLLTNLLIDRCGVLRGDAVRQWIVSGQVVAMTAGLLLIVAVYRLAAELFDRRVGLVAAGCAALLPEFARFSAEALSDTLHLTLFVAGLTLGAVAFRRNALWQLGVAGVLSGLAFLVRPEGGEVVAVLCGAALFCRRWSLLRRAAAIGVCSLCFLIAAGPYMLATGRLVKKKPIGQFVSAGTCEPIVSAGELSAATAALPAEQTAGVLSGVGLTLKAAGTVISHWVRSLRVTYLLAAAAWLAMRRKGARPGPAWRMVVAAGLFHTVVCIRLVVRFDYWDLFALRHVLVSAALTLPFAAAGVVAMADAIRARWSRRRSAWAEAAVMAAVVAPTLPWLLRAPNREHAYMREAACWIRDHVGGSPNIVTNEWRIPYYAGGVYCRRVINGRWHAWSGRGDPANLLEWIRAEKPDLVVLDERPLCLAQPDFFEKLEQQAGSPVRLERLHTLHSVGTRQRMAVRIYRCW